MKLYQAFNSVFNGKDTKTGLEILQKGNTQQGVLKNEKEKKRGAGGMTTMTYTTVPVLLRRTCMPNGFF